MRTEKVARLGLQDRVTIELKDYSRLDGTFDKIASIGMFEHVGYANHERYFTTMNRLLKPDGLYLHHAITRAGEAQRPRLLPQEHAPKPAPSPATSSRAASSTISACRRQTWSGTASKCTTLKPGASTTPAPRGCGTTGCWRISRAAEREVGAVKTRMWLIYLAGVSIAFERGKIGIFQTLASKRRRGASGVPLSRAISTDS